METGKKLRYDIKELSDHPEKLTKAYQEQEDRKKERGEQRHEWTEWEEYQKTLGKLLEKTHPLKKKETKAMGPTWTLLMEKWGTQKEKDELQYAHKK